MNQSLRDKLGTIRAAGFDPTVSQNKHLKVTWFDLEGRKHVLVLAVSPSDLRADRNVQVQRRRLLGRRP
jgi:hypothetical protein